jgi:2-dehydro-3-deoxyphosphogluconate aldolase/(4S)-4-hydroxy-2-oxoglutarate aldolase
MNTIERIARQPVLPVIVIDDAERAVPLAEALVAGGMTSLEVTFRTQEAAESIRRIRRALPELCVGAGTLLTRKNARDALDAGVEFGLAPDLCEDVVMVFAEAHKPFIPGVMTPTEIATATRMGCRYIKFFPAETAGGASALKAMNAPFKHLGLKFCPTGGVSPANMEQYLAMPEVFAVGGSWIATREQIANGEWDAISRQARDALTLAAKIRGK